MRKILSLLAACLVWCQAQAVSFDCEKAQSRVEKLICVDAGLSKADEQLAAAYKNALQDEQQADTVRESQRRWLKKRNGCSDVACVKRAYETRLHDLPSPEGISQHHVSPPVPSKRCYKLVVGKRLAMCREFEQNLNRYCGEPPMMCRFKINPDFGKDFSIPEWEELDPAKNLELVAQIMLSHFNAPDIAINPENVNCNRECAEREWQKVKPGYLEGIRAGRVVLSRARFDLNHDGTKELVYRLSGSQCLSDDPERYYIAPNFILMVMDEKTGKDDPDFATRNNVGVDVLLYQGRAYLVQWHSGVLDGNATPGSTMLTPDGMSDGHLTVYDILTGDQNVGRYYISMRPLCGYNYLIKARK